MTTPKKRRIHVDFETRSTVDLKKTGVSPYAKHPATDAWCMAYAVDDGPVGLWKMGEPFPSDLPVPTGDAEADDFVYVAHNAAFERAIWRHVMTPRYGWPDIPLDYWRCTMAMAYVMALPGSLDGASKAVGLKHEKDMAGNRLMLQLAKPRRVEPDGSIVWWDKPEPKDKWTAADKLGRVYEYCKQDIVVERALDERLLDLTPAELEVWRADQIINENGIPIDLKAANKALQVVDVAVGLLDREMREVTDRAVSGCTKVKDLIAWLQAQGVETDTVAKADLVKLLELPDLPSKARRALELRQLGSKSSTAKIKAMIMAACPDDGRVRGAHQYHGATTGRWAGRRVQFQNVPRPSIKQPQIDEIMQLLRSDMSPREIVDVLDLLHGQPMVRIVDCLRAFVGVGADRVGVILMGSDYGQIEARIVSWLAGHEPDLDVFRNNLDIYLKAASDIYRREITKKDEKERGTGKIAVLALGFQGGVGAFQSMARVYGAKFSDAEADAIKEAWRDARPKVVDLWAALERTAKKAIEKPRTVFRLTLPYTTLSFCKVGSFLWCELPSGRRIYWAYPTIRKKMMPWGKEKDTIFFKGVDSVTGQWREQSTYSGKLCENVVQATARDLIAHALVRLVKDPDGPTPIMHVHDEIVVQAPAGSESAKDALENAMCELPDWAKTLPVKSEGWVGDCFRK